MKNNPTIHANIKEHTYNNYNSSNPPHKNRFYIVIKSHRHGRHGEYKRPHEYTVVSYYSPKTAEVSGDTELSCTYVGHYDAHTAVLVSSSDK